MSFSALLQLNPDGSLGVTDCAFLTCDPRRWTRLSSPRLGPDEETVPHCPCPQGEDQAGNAEQKRAIANERIQRHSPKRRIGEQLPCKPARADTPRASHLGADVFETSEAQSSLFGHSCVVFLRSHTGQAPLPADWLKQVSDR